MLQQLAINSNTYHGFPLEEAIKGASKAGFSRIELSAVRDHTDHVLPDMSRNQLNSIKAVLREYEMDCIGISAHSNVMTEEGVSNLVKSIDLAVEFDCYYVTTATGDSHGDKDVIEDEAVLIQKLMPVIERCEELNKTLVLETHGNNYSTGQSLKRLAQLLDNRVRVNYDTGNVVLYGDTLPYDDLEQAIDYVEFIHLKDKRGRRQEWNFPAIGDGDLNYHRIFNILEQANFRGPISVEIEYTPSGPENLEEVNHSVNRSYHYLSNLLS